MLAVLWIGESIWIDGASRSTVIERVRVSPLEFL